MTALRNQNPRKLQIYVFNYFYEFHQYDQLR